FPVAIKGESMKDWWSCNGTGQTWEGGSEHSLRSDSRPDSPGSFPGSTRRRFLMGGLLSGLSWAAGARTALSQIAVGPGRERDSVLVVIFLRGGADGLNLIVPYGEDAYHKARPTLAMAAPTDRRKAAETRVLDLDGFFGLHPKLAPLLPLYREGKLAGVHAVGSGDHTRSHFEAMTAMERGQKAPGPGPSSGWIARHLSATTGDSTSPLRAVALGNVLPDSLRGATDATVLPSLENYRLRIPETLSAHAAPLQTSFRTLYESGGNDAVAQAGRETFTVLDGLRRMDPANYRPSHGASYPESPLGSGLRQVACLIRGRVGLEIACLDKGGWDTHVAQGTKEGWLALLLDDLGKSVAAFARDMGPEMRRVTVLLMTEFGRRVQENSGLGTDHGRGGAMFLLGGGVAGGKVYARWPGLEPEQREPPGDLRVTNDYRDVLDEILRHRFGSSDLEAVFPGFTPRFPGIVA
ncbi:MAG: DUF1501 domain-containing protein, partial [Armatimonadetes bacterium]|nr:DUF1501 domain-containing protein [Armatimonadota bacterium]